MKDRHFGHLLGAQWDRGRFACVGLDSEYLRLPESVERTTVSGTLLTFNSAIVDATKDVVGAFKPNVAFYEPFGDAGWTALRGTIAYIHQVAPDVPVILDAKRADIGNTNLGYVEMAFSYLKADAITVHPYLGGAALTPFLDRKDRGVIVLCRTSNPGSDELQTVTVRLTADQIRALSSDSAPSVPPEMPYYQYVAHRVARLWNMLGNCGLVVGATYPQELGLVRDIAPEPVRLIPGVGFQQKDVPLEQQVQQAVDNGRNNQGRGFIINSSRGIIFASKGKDFAEAARREAVKLHDSIRAALAQEVA